MISLGSCTMKLNATAEMIPVTWPQFANLHPFAPVEQTEGYRKLFLDLEEMLADCTGYDRISLQPNAGSAGEYAGLIAIKRYHESRGDKQRTVCLIPSSAHGTNPASAALLDMRVEIVECDSNGNVDVADLRRKAEQHTDTLAALSRPTGVPILFVHSWLQTKTIELITSLETAAGKYMTLVADRQSARAATRLETMTPSWSVTSAGSFRRRACSCCSTRSRGIPGCAYGSAAPGRSARSSPPALPTSAWPSGSRSSAA